MRNQLDLTERTESLSDISKGLPQFNEPRGSLLQCHLILAQVTLSTVDVQRFSGGLRFST